MKMFEETTTYGSKDLYEVYPKLFKRFGKSASIAGCGVAGEFGYANSGIVFNDLIANRPSRYRGVVAWVR
jgi:aldehyde:ferredoxin oxidoreductase